MGKAIIGLERAPRPADSKASVEASLIALAHSAVHWKTARSLGMYMPIERRAYAGC